MAEKLELYTAGYRAFKPRMGVPVRTSNGRPKYALPYVLEFKAPVLFPSRRLMKMSMADFEPRYFQQLDQMGVENVREQLGMIAEAAGDQRLVLLCFETSVKQCHRGVFAEWWKERTGEAVHELR